MAKQHCLQSQPNDAANLSAVDRIHQGTLAICSSLWFDSFGFQTWNMHMENKDTPFGWICKTQHIAKIWKHTENMSPLRPWPGHGAWPCFNSSWSLRRMLYNVSMKPTCFNNERPDQICNVTARAPPLWIGFETPTTTHIEKIGLPKPGHFSDHPLWGPLLREFLRSTPGGGERRVGRKTSRRTPLPRKVFGSLFV